MRRWPLALACMMASGAWPSGAAAQTPSTPGAAGAEAVVQMYNEAVVAGNWDVSAALLAPQDQERFRSLARLITESDPLSAAMLGIEPDASVAELLAAFVSVAMGEVPGMDETLAGSQSQILGTVLEGDSLAHVVVRTDMVLFERAISATDLTMARWDGTRWLVAVDDEIEAMIVGLEAARDNPDLFGIEDDYEMDTARPRDPKKQ